MSNANLVKLNIPASMKFLNVVSASIAAILEHLSIAGDVETAIYEIQLAVHEICTNIIEHAYGNDPEKRIDLEIFIKQRADSSLVIKLYDYSGIEFIAANVKAPVVEALQERGMGLMLINQIMDEVDYAFQDNRNCWTLVKKFIQAEA